VVKGQRFGIFTNEEYCMKFKNMCPISADALKRAIKQIEPAGSLR
jgi:hypothetical protein